MDKRLIIFVAFLTSSCLAKFNISEHKESLLVEAVVRILESCYTNRMTAIGLAGNSTRKISEALMRQGDSPLITLIDGTARKTSNVPVCPQNRYRLQVFVIIASSSMDLSRILNDIKTSIWWNHMAAFLVFDWQLSNQGCNNAFEMLWTTWEMNLLNATFLCHHWTNGRLIYTFNPYTNWAPEPWKLEKSYKGKNDHPWTLFVRQYEEDSEKMCETIDFEKTNDLGGYQIRVSSTSIGHEFVNSDRICPGVFENIYCTILFSALNATPYVLVHDQYDSVGYEDDKGNVNGMLGEAFHGLSDIALMGRSITIFTKVPMTCPRVQADFRCLTQYSGYKSQLSKIRSVIDSNARFGLYVVCIITFLFFKYVVRQSMPTAHLSTFRIICNSCLPKIPGKLGPRIYLGSLFLFALTMQGIYQGKLASLLTIQEPLRKVDTMTDLAELDYKIHGSPSFGVYFGNPAFAGRYIGTNRVCTKYVIRNPKAACVANGVLLTSDAAKYKLYVSREPLFQMYIAFPIRPDWPLEHIVNTILSRSVESGVLQLLRDNVHYHTLQLIEFQQNQYKDRKAKILTLKQLAFAFAILAIGLGIATISFIIEIALG